MGIGIGESETGKKASETRTIVTEEAISQALGLLFGVSKAEEIPPLAKYIKADGRRIRNGNKPLEDRVEYKLLKETPRNTNGDLTIEGMIDHYYKVRTRFTADEPWLAGARLIVALAEFTGAGEETRRKVKAMVVDVEYTTNAGGKECGGRKIVGDISYMRTMQPKPTSQRGE